MQIEIDKYQSRRNSGFTLIELAIVLIIISLIVAGVFTGRTLIAQARLTRIDKEIQQIQMITNTFKDRYNAYPGDMPNAEQFWGTYNATTNPNGVINGNGNFYISYFTDPTPEYSVFFQEIALAKIVNTDFAYDSIFPSVITNAYYGVGANNDQQTFYGSWGNFLWLAIPNVWPPERMAVLTPSEAKAIDVKIDDGNPSSGFFLGRNTWITDAAPPYCAQITANPTATYNNERVNPYGTESYAVQNDLTLCTIAIMFDPYTH